MSPSRSGFRGETAPGARAAGGKAWPSSDVSRARVTSPLGRLFWRAFGGYFRAREARQAHATTPLGSLGHVHECYSLPGRVYDCQYVRQERVSV